METNSVTTLVSDAERLEHYPPFEQMGVKVIELSDHFRRARILLPLTEVSKNPGGGMFGGYQASLADPIAALACARLFKGYSVWTRHLAVDFKREGITDLELRFDFPAELEARIQHELEIKGRSTPLFEYGYYMQDGSLCTLVHAKVAIRPRGYQAP